MLSITSASVMNYDCKCDATIWSVPYDWKTFIVQAIDEQKFNQQ